MPCAGFLKLASTRAIEARASSATSSSADMLVRPLPGLLLAVGQARSSESAGGVLGNRVPAAFRHQWRSATLATRRKARISTAPAAASLAREAVPIHVHATDPM